MKSKRLTRSFYNRPTLTVAKKLLGKFLVKGGKIGQINEVEAYIGDIDPACHAYNGITKRTKVMFGPAGFSYVYFIYGMYFCLNVVTEKEGNGCAVLIRSVKPVSGFKDYVKTDGPGKLCKAFGITEKDNGIDLCTSKDFFIEDRGCNVNDVKCTKRVGIKKGVELLFRFMSNFLLTNH